MCARRTIGGLAAVAVAILALLPAIGSADEITVVLQEGRDSFYGTRDVAISVDPKISQRNHGGADTIWIWQFDGVALVCFDFDFSVIPTDAIVQEAILELDCVSTGFAEEEIQRSWRVEAYQCTTPWKEESGKPRLAGPGGATLFTTDGAKTWPAGKPTAAAGRLLGAATLQGGETKWYKWPLDAETVQGWISGERDNNGIMLWGKPPGKAASFASREHANPEQRPILRLRLNMPREDVEKYPDWVKRLRFEMEPGHDELEPGKTYDLSKETPLMPTWNPQGAAGMKKIPAGGSIRIVNKKTSKVRLWYQVKAFDGQNRSVGEGWVNSLALIGQEISGKERWGRFRGLDVGREEVLSIFKDLDKEITFERNDPWDGQPRLIGHWPPGGFRINIYGPREDIVTVLVVLDLAVKPVDAALAKAGVPRILHLVAPAWEASILSWAASNIEKVQREGFREETEKFGRFVVTLQNSGDGRVSFEVQSEEWARKRGYLEP